MRLKLICCEIFFREASALAARSPNTVDVEFVPKGLHDLPSAEMLARLQERVDAADRPEYEALLLGYGLCNNGLAGLAARMRPLVLPRAHDCITLFLGSRERYRAYFDAHPGVFFHTSGWLERGQAAGDLAELSIQHRTGLDKSYVQLVAEYGEDNARYLAETLGGGLAHYGQFTYIEMGVEPDGRFERESRRRAAERGWKFEKMRGELDLLRRLLDGPWDARDFLRIPPGGRVRPCYDEAIVTAEPVACAAAPAGRDGP